MYISLLSLIMIGVFIFYFARQSNKGSKSDLNIINLLCAVAYIEKNIQTHKDLEDKKHQYAFLIQYVQDIQNLNIDELNHKWVSINNFFHSRTNPAGAGTPVRYTKFGRIGPNTIINIANMYKANSYNIGNAVWKDSIDYSNEIGKRNPKKGEYYYPKTIEELIEVIEIYDEEYTGNVLMPKR